MTRCLANLGGQPDDRDSSFHVRSPMKMFPLVIVVHWPAQSACRAAVDVLQTMLSSAPVLQTMLSSAPVLHTMLSSAPVLHTMLSPASPAVLHTMLSSAPVLQTMLS